MIYSQKLETVFRNRSESMSEDDDWTLFTDVGFGSCLFVDLVDVEQLFCCGCCQPL